jgi:5-methylcytosine-specific restriction enzyme A
MAWTGSTRRARLPDDWAKRRAAVLERDPVCQLRIVCSGSPSTEADHVKPGDDHRPSNLQGVCLPCHLKKSSAEGHAARVWRPRRRPTERHPGLF